MTSLGCAIQIDTAGLKHIAISASAGSGKTYRLATRYLQLIAAGAEPSSILASTFTRLAAGEIRDRVLTRLASAVNSPAHLDKLRTELGANHLSRPALLVMLKNLAHRLDQMQIRTLDSFFASVTQAFAIELELPVAAGIVDDEQAALMRTEAIRLMLNEKNPQELIDLLRQLTDGSSGYSVIDTIDTSIQNLHSLYIETSDDKPWECVPDLPVLPEDQIDRAIERLQTCAMPADKNWEKAHEASTKKAWARDWPNFINTGLPKSLAAGISTYYKKEIDSEIASAYRPLVEHARGVLVGRWRRQTIATRDLLKHYHQQIDAVKHRHRALTFDDLTMAMARAQRLGTLDQICFRIDANLHHVLLDEFQDTSVSQWRALEPMVQELVSCRPPDRTFFCVGDVKQSIYGWRDAAPEVLDELPRLLVGPDGQSAIQQDTLFKSYRSSPVVINAVNRLFGSLADNAALEGRSDAVAAWLGGYVEHETHHTDLKGYVELRECQRAVKEQDEVQKFIRYQEAADLACAIHKQNPNLKIALLTRGNNAVAHLLYELGPSRRNISGGVSGRGGGPLTDAPAVNAILDLLQMADHPDDTIAAFNVAMSPLGLHLMFTNYADRQARRRVAREVRRRLLHDGYGTTISSWVISIAPDCDAREVRRLHQLVEMASAYDSQRTLRTGDFIDVVESRRIADVKPAAVTIMTIHQSKGLDFDVVILPDLEWELICRRPPPVVFERADEIGLITKICRHVKKEIQELAPELQAMFDRYQRRSVRESLSLLYVAMTRAKQGLYMLIDPPRINSGKLSTIATKTAAGILRCGLHGGGQAPQCLFREGDPDWMRHSNVEQSVMGSAENTLRKLEIKLKTVANRRLPMGRAAASASSTHESHASLRDLLTLPNRETRDHGVAVHALLEQIEWLEDFQIDERRLQLILADKFPKREAAWRISVVQSFLNSIQRPTVREHLCRGCVDATLQLHREFPFARRTEDGLQRGYIDRMVVQLGTQCAPVAATIIDFKTDAIAADEAAVHAEIYRPQMDAYRAAAMEWLSLDASAVSVRLLFVTPGVAVEM